MEKSSPKIGQKVDQVDDYRDLKSTQRKLLITEPNNVENLEENDQIREITQELNFDENTSFEDENQENSLQNSKKSQVQDISPKSTKNQGFESEKVEKSNEDLEAPSLVDNIKLEEINTQVKISQL